MLPGDTLSGIARAHDQTYQALLGRNRQYWDNPDLIYPGDEIRLTGKVRERPNPRALAQDTHEAGGEHPEATPAPAASGSPRAYARSQLLASQYTCLVRLFNRESGWNPYATNPSSGAYGIPQALPGSKMASAGADWRTNGVTQVRWAIHQYIPDRYGSPCAALAHSNRVGWY